MMVINSHQLIDMLQHGVNREVVEQYEVLIVQDFEGLQPQLRSAFLRAIATFRELQMGLAMRMVLVSGRVIPSEFNDFDQFKPTLISADENNDEPEDLNARVHLLIEQGTALSGIPIVRLTERAAVFLEYYTAESNNLDALELILLGMQRSDEGILRFRDFLPDLFDVSDSFSSAVFKRN
ncbi:MAG: hypothetical protein H7333_11870 [Bdellovibrionales bacterium]|nr:hypothetical protein [Oligoflexia bacterium]